MRVLSAEDGDALDAAAAALVAGEAIVVPTDTVYGVAVLPGGEDDLARLKSRPADMPIAVLVADVDQVATLATVPEAAADLMDRHWPGALTVVLPGAEGGGTVGVRLPDHPFVRALAERVGPIATTSANRHGAPTPPTALEAAAALSDEVALVVDGGPCEGAASTVVDATVDPPRVLRAGPIEL